MKNTSLFLFFLIFFFNKSFAFSENNSKRIRFDSISEKVSFHSKKKEYKKSLYYSRKLLLEALKNKNLQQEATSYYKIAQYHRKLKAKDSAFYYYRVSKEISIDIQDSVQVGRCLFNIAVIESGFAAFTNSDLSAIEGLKFLNGKRKKTITGLYNCMAINSTLQNLHKQAVYNYKKALKFHTSKPDKIRIQNNLANAYKDLKEYKKSILIFEILLKDGIANNKTKARVISNLAYTKWLQNPEIDVLKELLLAEAIRKQENDTYGLNASYSHLSEYFKEKNTKTSLEYAFKMYQLSKKEKAPKNRIEAIDKLVALQTPQSSISYYREGIHIRDSLKEVAAKRQYSFAKIKYNYEEEEKQKLKFKAVASENKLIVIAQRNQKKNILSIAFVLTVGLLFLIYRRKQQHKKQILQESYTTEIRISKKLHDELGNDIFNIMTKVQNDNFKNEDIVNDLDSVYLQTRSISHENDSIETGAKFEDSFKALLSNYNSQTVKIISKDLSALELNSLSKEKQVVLYRVFNELFVNMKKHSKASLVVLSCKKTDSYLEMKYVDNGIGCKNNTVILKNGLKNTETRIKTIRGRIIFESELEKGCKITVRFKK